MGSPESEPGRNDDEGPQHKVTIAKPFAVSKFEVTFAEWDACVDAGGCEHRPTDAGWGRGTRPVLDMSWNDVTQQYLPWLTRVTGQTYRLLSEAEWEYAARGGKTTRYSWGDDPGANNANCRECESQWDFKQTAPVGSFKPNDFGLYDMHGNVWEWIDDCYADNYIDAPNDGTARTSASCRYRILRGGGWYGSAKDMRAARRMWYVPDARLREGFRVARAVPAAGTP
jgi:formylglycine-generating enzyme required for sulfatase activity